MEANRFHAHGIIALQDRSASNIIPYGRGPTYIPLIEYLTDLTSSISIHLNAS